ncbi:MAG: TonB-dependent receptor, partial [Bacteroidota bacterium]
ITSEEQIASRNVVPPHALKGSSANIVNALDHFPGFFKVQNNNYSLVYRGFYGNRLRIEQNGSRRTGVTAAGGFFGEDINPENISRLRIINGIDKAIYGSGAMGGVLQMDEWKTPTKNSTSFYQSFALNNLLRISGIKTTFAKNDRGLTVSLRTSHADDYRVPDGTKVGHSGYEQHSLSLSGFLRDQSGRHTVNIIQKASKGLWQRPMGFQNNPFELRSFRNRHHFQTDIRHLFNPGKNWQLRQQFSVQTMETDQIQRSFDATMEQLNVERTRTYLKSTQNYRIDTEMTSSSFWKVSFGMDGYRSVIDERLSENNLRNNFSFDDEPLSLREDLQGGLFALVRATHGKWQYRLATRFDLGAVESSEDSQNFSVITGGLEAGWQPLPLLSMNWSLGRFFRYPSQLEATGILFGGRGTFVGNPDIAPEYSYQLEWQLSGRYSSLSYQMSSWYTYLNDRISEVPLGNNTFTYENVENARNMGLELTLTQRFLINSGQSGSPQTDGQRMTAIDVIFTGTGILGDQLSEGLFSKKTDPLLGIPPNRWSLMLRYEKVFQSSVVLSTHSRLERVQRFDRLPEGFINQTFGAVTAPAYWLLNFGVDIEKQISSYRLHFGINGSNLTNSRYMPFGTRIQEIGRNIQINVRCSF